MSMKKICAEDLNFDFNINTLNFKNTSELDEKEDFFIKQEKAKRNIELGLNIKRKEYNIYCCCNFSQKPYLKQYLKNKIEELVKANKDKVPDDLCLIYNFKEKNKPLHVYLEAGVGSVFHNDMKDFCSMSKNSIQKN